MQCQLSTARVAAFSGALFSFHLAFVCVAVSQEDAPAPRDPASLIARPGDAKLAAAILGLGEQGDVSPVPVLAELFRNAPRRESGDDIHPVREAVLRAAISRCGTDKEAKTFLQDLLVAYLDGGSRAKPGHRALDDQEYGYAIFNITRVLPEHAEPEMAEWFLAVYKRIDDYGLRENIYAGYLRAKALSLGPADKRIAWLLDQVASPGTGEWDYFHHELEDGPGRPGKKEWAIRDTACCRVLAMEGVAALPVLEREWEELEARQPLPQKEQRRQYGIAYVIGHIRVAAKLPLDKRLRSRPIDWEDKFYRRLDAYKAKMEALKEQKQKKKEGAPEAPQ